MGSHKRKIFYGRHRLTVAASSIAGYITEIAKEQ